MAYDPKAAERLATAIESSIEYEDGYTEDEVVALIRAQAAEIERLTTSGICEVAASNSSVMDYMRHWEERAEKAEAAVQEARNTALREASSYCADKAPRRLILALIDTPAPQPDADEREAIDKEDQEARSKIEAVWKEIDDRLTNQSEREALIAFLKDAVNKKPADGKPYDHMADALLADGWTRKREEG